MFSEDSLCDDLCVHVWVVCISNMDIHTPKIQRFMLRVFSTISFCVVLFFVCLYTVSHFVGINVMFLVEPQKSIEYKKILGMKHKYQILKSLF